MDRPIQCAVVMMVTMAVGSAQDRAGTAPSARRERAVSPRVAEMLSAAVPKFQPVAAAAADPAAPVEASAARMRVPAEIASPANGIVRLPEYIVREPREKRLPKYEEVLVPRELEKLAMREFLGDERGFDRGFLNLFNLADLWKKIPILGVVPLPGFERNEDRAMRMYRADREAKAWAELRSLLSPELRPRPGEEPPAKK